MVEHSLTQTRLLAIVTVPTERYRRNGSACGGTETILHSPLFPYVPTEEPPNLGVINIMNAQLHDIDRGKSRGRLNCLVTVVAS
jgi:hypothetical protein